jgi:2'-5' RNA ligase
MGWTTYFSVTPSEETVAQLVELQTFITKDIDTSFSSHQPDWLHLTLLFLGQFLKKVGRESPIEDEEYESTEEYQAELSKVMESLKQILSKGEYELAFENPSIERLPKNPKEPNNKNLVVVKLQPTAKSLALYEALYAEFLEGKEVDFTVFRDWKPHFTLGQLSQKDVDLSSLEVELAKSQLQNFKADNFYLAGQSTSKLTWLV